MAIADDVIQLLYKGVMLNQTFLNRFFYQVVSGTPGVEDIVERFRAQVVPKLRAIMCDKAIGNQIMAVNLRDDSDSWDGAVNYPGLVAAAEMPSHDAWGFELITPDRRIRNGGKRIAGPPELWVNGNTVNPANAWTVAQAAAAMGEQLVNTSQGWSAQPVLYTPGNLRLIEPAAIPISAVIFKRVTTQSSRKPYRGD